MSKKTNEKGTLSYNSYWWTEEDPKKVLKISAYEWITVGDARWIVASSSDFYERNGLALQKKSDHTWLTDHSLSNHHSFSSQF